MYFDFVAQIIICVYMRMCMYVCMYVTSCHVMSCHVLFMCAFYTALLCLRYGRFFLRVFVFCMYIVCISVCTYVCMKITGVMFCFVSLCDLNNM